MRSSLTSILIPWFLFALAFAAPPPNPPPSPSPQGSFSGFGSTTNVTTYYISGDAGSMVPLQPGQSAKQVANAPTTGYTIYTLLIAEQPGSPTFAQPGFRDYLYGCTDSLMGQAGGLTVPLYDPYPQGKYSCNGSLPGLLWMNIQAKNKVNYGLSFSQVQFILKVLYKLQAVKDQTPYFNFEVRYTNDAVHTPEPVSVVVGQWAPIPAS